MRLSDQSIELLSYLIITQLLKVYKILVKFGIKRILTIHFHLFRVVLYY